MSARDDIVAGLRQLDESQPGDATPEELLAAFRTEVLNEVVETLAATRRRVEDADGMELAEELVRGMVTEDEQRQVGASVAKLRRTLAPTPPVPDNTTGDEGEVERLRVELAQMRAARDVIASLHRDLNARLNAVLDICDREQRGAMRWQDPLPVPEWVAPVQRAALGDDVRTPQGGDR